MKFVAAYLLAQLGGAGAADREEGAPIPPPGKDDVRRILESVGAVVDEDRLDMLFAELNGKDFAELIAAGRERFSYALCAGAGVAVGCAALGAGAAAGATEAKEEKEEEKMVEEEDDGLGFSLFDED